MPLAALEAMRRAHGLPVPDPDAVALTDLDVEAIRTAGAFREAGVSDEQMLRAIRVLGRGMAQAAETLRAIGLELALEPGSSEAELAQRFAERSAAVVPMLGPMLEQMLRLHLRHAVGLEALGADERAAGHAARRARGRRRVRRPRRVHAARRGGTARPSSARSPSASRSIARDLRDPPVRLVKTIGDAAMLVSSDVGPLLACALDLHEAAAGEGDEFPPLRVGVARGPGGRARGRLVRAAGQPREPRDRDRAARQRARDARGPRRGARRLPLVVGGTAVAARRRRAGRAVPRAARRGRRLTLFDPRAALEAHAVGADDAGVGRDRRLGDGRGRRGGACDDAPSARRTRRTSGTASHASAANIPSTPRPTSVACRPAVAAIGPATAIPSGIRPSETLKS